MVAGAMLSGSVAMAAHGNDQARSKTKVRAAKSTATSTMTTGGNRSTVRTRQISTGGSRAVRTGNFSNRTRVVSGSRTRYSYPSRSYSYGYRSYGYGYPYYSYGPSVSFGFGYPYSYGYYGYNRPGYDTYANGSIVIQVQSRLARAGYYRGAIDGAMGPRTHYAIQAYEHDHGLRVDGAISGQLLRNMGLRY
jgi:peptidoglycan hydrolase-like protein with peptidoglycan-binding domain